VVVQLIRHTPGPAPLLTGSTAAAATTSRSAASSPSVPKGFPAPPPGAVVFAREDKADVLALGLVPRSRSLLAQVSILSDQGNGVRGLAVILRVQGAVRRAASCGPGCYRANFAFHGNPGSVGVDVSGKGAAIRWTVPLPARWPPPVASALVTRAAAAWRDLHSLAYIDRLASAPGEEITSFWEIVAPDRISYSLPNGSAAIIVGSNRWDRARAGGTWTQSPQLPVTQPVPFWSGVRDAHLLGSGTVAGHQIWRVSFFDPASLAWFAIAIDKSTLHTLDLHMIAASHFMHDTYGPFDNQLRIEPPG
jgi:hypothetical protein